jgi:hypothetical protein
VCAEIVEIPVEFGTVHHMPTPHTVCGVVNGGVCRTGLLWARGLALRSQKGPLCQVAHELFVELVFGPLLGESLVLGKGNVLVF